MTEARTIVARVLIALALIVQIVAPARASVSMVAAVTDPLAAGWICGHDGPPTDGVPTADACRLCDLVCHGGGFAATPPTPTVATPVGRVIEVLRPRAVIAAAPGPFAAAFLARGPPTIA